MILFKFIHIHIRTHFTLTCSGDFDSSQWFVKYFEKLKFILWFIQKPFKRVYIFTPEDGIQWIRFLKIESLYHSFRRLYFFVVVFWKPENWFVQISYISVGYIVNHIGGNQWVFFLPFFSIMSLFFYEAVVGIPSKT